MLGDGDVDSSDATADEVVLSRLVHALFRQQVHVGALGDPLGDALDASAGRRRRRRRRRRDGAARRVGHAGGARAALARRLEGHAANLGAMVPRFAPGWMPRTDDRVAIPLAGGRVVLRGTFDLLVGIPRPGAASLCALGLSTGGTWVRARRSLHYLALLETLRSGAPPFRLALLESATGRYGVEDVREEHLRALASHLAAVLARDRRGESRDPPPRRTPRVAEGLTGALLAPLPVFDAASWRAAFDDATSVLAGLAVLRAGGGPFRVTDHEVRVALGGAGGRAVAVRAAASRIRRGPRNPSRSPGPPGRPGARSAWRRCAGWPTVAPALPPRPSAPGWRSRACGCATAARGSPRSTAGSPGCRRPDGRRWRHRRSPGPRACGAPSTGPPSRRRP